MTAKGVRVDDVSWSGFWCQGSGAWFGGRIENFAMFMDAYSITMPTLRSALAEDDADGVFRSLTYRRDWMVFEEELCFHAITFYHPLEVMAWDMKLEVAEKEWERFCEAAKAIFRDAAAELYKQLEAEYEYLTSDETILESLITADYMEGILDDYEFHGTEEDHKGKDAIAL